MPLKKVFSGAGWVLADLCTTFALNTASAALAKYWAEGLSEYSQNRDLLW